MENIDDHIALAKALNQALSEKPKRLKPRRAIRSLSFRLGRFQAELTIWKWRKV